MFSLCFFCFQTPEQFWKIDYRPDHVCVCLSVSLSLTSDSSETVEVIIVKLGTVTASDMRMHHRLTILTLTVIQVQTDLNRENNKCSITSGNCSLCKHLNGIWLDHLVSFDLFTIWEHRRRRNLFIECHPLLPTRVVHVPCTLLYTYCLLAYTYLLTFALIWPSWLTGC